MDLLSIKLPISKFELATSLTVAELDSIGLFLGLKCLD